MRRLSGGMKRRVLVAQALVHKPPVIVLTSRRPASMSNCARACGNSSVA
jgi:ABC-type Na+ transport system ATPase subunit NatA